MLTCTHAAEESLQLGDHSSPCQPTPASLGPAEDTVSRGLTYPGSAKENSSSFPVGGVVLMKVEKGKRRERQGGRGPEEQGRRERQQEEQQMGERQSTPHQAKGPS